MSSGVGVKKARAAIDSGHCSSTSGQICHLLQVPVTPDGESISHLLQLIEIPYLVDSNTVKVTISKVYPLTVDVDSVGKRATAVTFVVMEDQSNVGTVKVYDTRRNLAGMQANNV